jgi:hypothetical protein
VEKLTILLLRKLLIAFFALILCDAIISFCALQKQSAEKSPTEECSFEKEIKEESKQAKIKMKNFSMPFDDDICHKFYFFNPYINISYRFYNSSAPIIQNGHPNFVYSPPEHLS